MPALLVAVALAAASPDRAPVREMLPGGPELVVLPIPDAGKVSLRVVVRAGSSLDPVGKEGLAHQLEHAILDGNDRGHALLDTARAAGAWVNGRTGRDTTEYILDAPASTFEPLAERLLKSITSPTPDPKDLDRQFNVVSSEGKALLAEYESSRYLENALFALPEPTPLGTYKSRSSVGLADLLDWYQRHYIGTAMTVVIAGEFSAERARALLRRAYLSPPAMPEEVVARKPGAPVLPLTQKVPAPLIAVLHGYHVDAEGRAACEQVAALVELRLMAALTIKEPLLSPVQVRCFTMRRNTFIGATGHTLTLDSPELPERVAQVFRSVATTEATPKERRILERRLAFMGRLRAADPIALADEAARLAGGAEGGESPLPSAQATFRFAEVRAVARRIFRPERQFSFILSPFGT